MSVGTAIVIVGGMFAVVALLALLFARRMVRSFNKEQENNLCEFVEERRQEIRRGARRTDARFSLSPTSKETGADNE